MGNEGTSSKVWFITGAGRGFGREFAVAALERGDHVAATARSAETVQDFVETYGDAVLPIEMDVTDRDQVDAAVDLAVERFGRLDVVVNNAGYGLFGMVEEIGADELRAQLDVNLFGVLNVTQAVLPTMRQQRSGHIVQISTVGGIAAFPGLGGYHASKWALEGLSESLAQEVAAFGIKVTLVEPGSFSTDWAGSSAAHTTPMEAYDGLRSALAASRSNTPPQLVGDPASAGPALLSIVDAPEPPLRVLFGLMPTKIVPGLYEKRLATWDEWEHVSLAANGH